MRHRLEYLVVVSARLAMRLLPDVGVHACGTLLGWIVYVCSSHRRRIALANLAAAFPARPMAERRAIARATFGHFGRSLFQLLKFSTLTPDAMRRRVDFEGDERARLAYAQGRGAIFFTGHFGYWEVNGIAHALKFEPIGVLARTLDNPHLNALLERIRRATGNAVIYRRGGLRRVLRTLHARAGVAVLIDQHVLGPDAVYVDFFERPVATTPLVAALTLRTGCVVVPVFALPMPRGRYRMIYEHPIEPPSDETPAAIREFTQRCTDVLEMYVRRHPQLWLWMHRRWREVAPAGIPTTVSSSTRDIKVET